MAPFGASVTQRNITVTSAIFWRGGGILHVLGVLFGILTIFTSTMQENDFRQSEMQREATLNDFSDMTVDS